MKTTSDSKTYIITGASRGVGREIRALLAGRGDKVIALGRTALDGPSLNGSCPDWVECDLADRQSVKAASGALISACAAPLNGVFLNAAMAGFGNVSDMAPDQVEEIFRVNLFSQVELLAGLRKILPPGSGIVCMSTSASRLPAPKMGAYAASKLAFEGLMQTMAMEEGWKLSIVRPAEIDTEFARDNGVPDEFDSGVKKLTAREVAAAAVACLDGGRLFANVGIRARIIDAVVRIRPQWLINRRPRGAGCAK